MQESFAWLLGAGRLQNAGGNLAPMPIEQGLDAGDVVIAEGHCKPLGSLWNAGIHGCGTDEPVIDREERVVDADGNEIAPSIGARQPDSARRRIRTVLAELHHLCPRDEPEE